MKIVIIATLLTILSFPGSCTDQQLEESLIAEQLYIDLLFDLEHDNDGAAFASIESLHIQLDRLRGKWRRPMSKTNAKACRHHLDEAEAAFTQAREAVKHSNLVAAEIYLERAMIQLKTADESAFKQLYMGRLFDFYTVWLETDMIVNDQMLCLLEWSEYVMWANQALAEWQLLEKYIPNQALYQFTDLELNQFLAARDAVTDHLNQYLKDLSRGDQCNSQVHAAAVSTSVWELIQTFKSDDYLNVIVD